MVSAQNLTKTYGDYSLNIDFEIPKGRVTGLVGKNGAGKSTTIKLLLGLIRPDSGRITVFGKEADTLTGTEKQNLGAALSDSGFSGYLTAAGVTKILKKSYDNFDARAFENRCRQMGLPMNKQIKDYSTGMKAKLRVLVALSHNAKLLVMDEPTAGLDIEARNSLLDMLRDYLAEDEDRSILITSHISQDLEGICDDIYLIHKGKIILHEDTDVILDRYGLIKVGEEEYKGLDKEYLIGTKKEAFGYTCFTADKYYYRENYPKIVVENGTIDDLILIMTGGR